MEQEDRRKLLDDLFIEYFELVQNYNEIRTQLAAQMKEGFWNFGKSRYVMGAISLSPEYYDMNMKTTQWLFDAENCNQFTLRKINISDKKEEESINKSQGDSQENSLRKRRKNDLISKNKEKDIEEKEPKLDNDETKNNLDKAKKITKDPINWFTALPPNNLRQTQIYFTKSLNIIVDLANITRKMDEVQRKYLTLLEQK